MQAIPEHTECNIKLAAAQDEQRAMTSMRVFREFIKRTHNRDGVDYIDASGVISRECYDLWVSTRKQLPPNPEKAFQRSLSAHVTGVDGRVPFTPSEEAAVLRVLRRKERWPCFEQSSTRFGLMGFRAKGYHEKSGDTVSSPDYMHRRFHNDNRKDDSDISDSESGSDHKRWKTLSDGFPSHSTYRDANPYMLTLPAPYAFPGWAHCNTMQLENLKRPAQKVIDPSGFSFLDIANTLLSKSSETGIDAWGTILCTARMLLLAQGWLIPPQMEDAQILLREYESKYPGSNIVALDPMARNSKNRVVLLSMEAAKYLGPVGRAQNGLERQLISTGDAWNMLTTVFSAFKSPGLEFANNLTIICLDGVLRSARCYFCMHPPQRILIVRADII